MSESRQFKLTGGCQAQTYHPFFCAAGRSELHPVSADFSSVFEGQTFAPRFHRRSRKGEKDVTSRRTTFIPVSFRGLPLLPPQSGSLIVAQGGAWRGGERNAPYGKKKNNSTSRGTRSVPRGGGRPVVRRNV